MKLGNQKLKKWISGIIVMLSCSLQFACIQPDRKLIITPAKTNHLPFPVSLTKSQTGADPKLSDQWALEKIGMTEVWKSASTTGTRRVKVAIVGTGVDYNHEDLRENIWINPEEGRFKNPADRSPLDEQDDDNNGYADDWVGWDVLRSSGLAFDQIGTGTAMAGVIGALSNNGVGIRGINAQVSMIPIRYIDENGIGKIPDLIKALTYAHVAKPDVVVVHLTNLDFAQGIRNEERRKQVHQIESSGLLEALENLKKASIPVIVSAGNSGADLGKSKSVLKRISQMENVFIVTSVDQADKRPFITNYGMQIVATAAPGEEILTTLPGNRYGNVSGTSIAAAHVAGAIALATSKYYGRFTYKDYFKVLLSESGSDPLAPMEFESKGGNRLNISKFLAALERS